MNVYQQLYDIIGEAVYGTDAVLTTAQDFVLTQICTFMSYGVILLPAILVLVVTVRLFRI